MTPPSKLPVHASGLVVLHGRKFSFLSKGRIGVQRLALPVAVVSAVAVAASFALVPPQVTAVEVVRGTAIEAVYASGSVEAKSRVDVRARVAGPLKNLVVREGDSVEKDQIVARIDAPALEYDVQRGKVDLSAASERATRAPQLAALEAQRRALEAQLAEATDELHRQEGLKAADAIPLQQLQRAQTVAASIAEQVAANRAQQLDVQIGLRGDALRQRAIVASLQDRARDTDVRSPMTGTVLIRRAEEGEVVSVNQSLMRIGDLHHLWIESNVDEADVGRVRVGMQAAIELNAFSSHPTAGHVTQILPDGDRNRKSFEVDIDFDEPVDGLLSGMTAEVNIVVKRHERALLIPADAVKDGVVWVVDRDNRAERREVKLGIRDLLSVEVLDGLAERERVILDRGGIVLQRGRKLRTLEIANSSKRN